MNISRLITSASLALAMVGGAIAFTPASVEAAAKKKPRIGCLHSQSKCKPDPRFNQPPRFKKCPKGRACLH